jgi:hypothetical protein
MPPKPIALTARGRDGWAAASRLAVEAFAAVAAEAPYTHLTCKMTCIRVHCTKALVNREWHLSSRLADDEMGRQQTSWLAGVWRGSGAVGQRSGSRQWPGQVLPSHSGMPGLALRIAARPAAGRLFTVLGSAGTAMDRCRLGSKRRRPICDPHPLQRARSPLSLCGVAAGWPAARGAPCSWRRQSRSDRWLETSCRRHRRSCARAPWRHPFAARPLGASSR